jgi:hypothetical protein
MTRGAVLLNELRRPRDRQPERREQRYAVSVTPEKFLAEWKGRLVRLPPNVPRPVGADFLIHPGLPAEVLYGPLDNPYYVTFVPIEHSLVRVTDEPIHGDWPSECADHLILGKATILDARPWWCLHQPSGRVDCVDIEAPTVVTLINSTVAHLAASLLAFRRWVEGATHDSHQLRFALEAVDPSAWGKNEWSALVDHWEAESEELPSKSGLDLVCDVTARRRVDRDGNS